MNRRHDLPFLCSVSAAEKQDFRQLSGENSSQILCGRKIVTMALGFQSCELSWTDVSFGDHLNNTHEGRETGRCWVVVVVFGLYQVLVATREIFHLPPGGIFSGII